MFIVGLATDYCVKETALDALKEGFRTTVVTDLIEGIEASAGDCTRALKEIEEAGGKLMDSRQIRELLT